METIEVQLLRFEELSETAKQTAINNARGSFEMNVEFIYNDAHESVKEFVRIFNLNSGAHSWLDFNTSSYDDDILDLKGLRLRKYIINNFYEYIYSGKYMDSIGDNKIIKHKNIKTNYYDISKGARVSSSNFYYSSIFIECSCPFTGVCYDMDLLDPILKLINEYSPKIHDNMDIEDLISECSYSLRKSLESESDYLSSDEYISERLVEDEVKFLDTGIEW